MNIDPIKPVADNFYVIIIIIMYLLKTQQN